MTEHDEQIDIEGQELLTEGDMRRQRGMMIEMAQAQLARPPAPTSSRT